MPSILEEPQTETTAQDRQSTFARRLAISILRFAVVLTIAAGISGGWYMARTGFGGRTRARIVEELHRRGMDDATIYDPLNTSVEGTHAFFIVRGDARTYNLPPAPEVPTTYLKKSWRSSAIAAGLLLGGTLLAFLSDGARSDGRGR